ncbi:uncharacterized protein LOC110118905 [Ceratitis capitata]|uniref:uncharacterized protein LOC110118905 n=1 Tax=Ceratitis capitata TaxID=7213 RepID=UPI000A0FCA82|nr:uncharacterized protein LOC110118905 [Ceratitis capitata]
MATQPGRGNRGTRRQSVSPPHKSNTKFALLYIAAVVNVTRTNSLLFLSHPLYFLNGGNVSFYSNNNLLGSGIFPIKGSNISGAYPQIVILNSLAVVQNGNISGIMLLPWRIRN